MHVTWREGYVAGGATRFFVRAMGHGPDLVVLLHGWPEDGTAWRHVAPTLADAGYRVVAPDLKGFGRSEAPKRGYDSRTLADEISRLITSLHVRKAVLVGHDWGGAVALATAFRHPGRVRALVLVNSPYRHLDLKRAWHIPLFNVPLAPDLLFKVQARTLVGAVLRHASVHADAFPDRVVDEYAEAIARNPHGWLSYYRTLSRQAIVDTATGLVRRVMPGVASPPGPHRLRVPAAMLWGEDDPVLPLASARADARDLDVELRPIPGCGHFPHEEMASTFTAELLDVLADLGATPQQIPAHA